MKNFIFCAVRVSHWWKLLRFIAIFCVQYRFDLPEVKQDLTSSTFSDDLYDSLKFTFDLTLGKMISDDLKIARFNPAFEGGDRSKLGNYRPKLVFPCQHT